MCSASKNNPRLFIGIACHPADAIRSLLRELTVSALGHPGLRIVSEADLHITLKFIGSTQPENVPLLAEMMRHCASMTCSFSLQIHGAGSFSNALWLGVEPSGELRDLVARIDAGAVGLGYEPEERPYVPHVTVAKIGRNCLFDRDAWLKTNGKKDWQQSSVACMNLYRSDTGPEGPRYTVIEREVFSAARPVD